MTPRYQTANVMLAPEEKTRWRDFAYSFRKAGHGLEPSLSEIIRAALANFAKLPEAKQVKLVQEEMNSEKPSSPKKGE